MGPKIQFFLIRLNPTSAKSAKNGLNENLRQDASAKNATTKWSNDNDNTKTNTRKNM